jgi:hypothetical protein
MHNLAGFTDSYVLGDRRILSERGELQLIKLGMLRKLARGE